MAATTMMTSSAVSARVVAKTSSARLRGAASPFLGVSAAKTRSVSAKMTTTTTTTTTRAAVVASDESSSSSAASNAAAEKKKSSADLGRIALLATVASNPILFAANDAMAKGGEFGILEGRTAALVHPFFLGGLWFATAYAGYLGWQWRRVRTTGNEIAELKASLPSGDDVELSSAQRETKGKIDELTTTRKELVAGGFKDKHNNVGSLLLAFGTALAVEGGMNTYLRTGKLSPGPHLYAGMGIVCLWAAAAGLVPEMQRGNEKARNAHIALNAVNLALFTWQIPTGLEIVGKVFQFTSWP